MLVDSVLLSLGYAANVQVVKAAQVFMYHIAWYKGRRGILIDFRWNTFSGKLSSKVQLLCSNYLGPP